MCIPVEYCDTLLVEFSNVLIVYYWFLCAIPIVKVNVSVSGNNI